MKKPIILISFLLFTLVSDAQNKRTFELTDTVFQVGQIYRADSIFFDLGKADLRPESFYEIEKILEFLNRNKNIEIEVGCHLDFKTPLEYSIVIDQRRAESVVDYLIAHGISKDRFLAKGYDNTQPLTVDSILSAKYDFLPLNQVLTESFIKSLPTVEEQETAKFLNRRIELKILSTDY